MNPDIQVEAEKFIQDMTWVQQAIGSAGISNSLEAGARVIEAHAKINAPVDTGFLRNSIMVAEMLVSPTGGYVVVAVYAEYAAHVEFGTVKMQAQPYISPAVYDNENKIRDVVAAQIVREINKALG